MCLSVSLAVLNHICPGSRFLFHWQFSITYVQGLANDLGPRVRVNCVSPGLTNTEMWSGLPAEKREGMLAGFGAKLPLKRAGESDDVGNAIAMLLCATYTTGLVFDVDGGAAIRE